MSKGSQRRPTAISKHEERLRWKLAYGQITFEGFEKRMKALRKQGLVDLLCVVMGDLPSVECPNIDVKFLCELWGHPIITMIKSGQNIPVGLRIYYNIPVIWVLDWTRKWA